MNYIIMKIFSLLILLFPLFIYGQKPTMSIKTQADVFYIKKQIPLLLKGEQAIIDELPIMKIDGELYVSFLGKLHNPQFVSAPAGVIIGNGTGKIRSVRIKLLELDLIDQLSAVAFLELAGKINPHLDRTGYDTRVDSVHLGLNLPQAFSGANVLLGINDWGYDYTHPMFYDTTLTENRIASAWDQFKNAGNKPTDYPYGAEYNTTAELLAAEGDTTNQLGTGTHGTHVAGIAGGSGGGAIAKGMAFESKFLFTTIRVDEASALDSWYWMQQKSHELDKRLVINMSWGLYHFGTNDGTSLLSQALDELSDEGVLFVSSAGNNGSVRFHFERTFDNDSIKSRVQFYNYAYHDSLWGQSIHGWGEVGKNFDVKFQVKSGTGALLFETPYYPTTMNDYLEDFTILNGTDTIWYTIAAQSAHPQNSKPTCRLRIKNKHTAYAVDLVVKAVDGKVHFWNLVELTTNGGNWGQEFNAYGTGYITGNTNYGIGEPSCATKCITVASHAPSYLHTNGVNVLGGGRSPFSSIGPRNDGAMKPDISAPGTNILSSISSFSEEGVSGGTTTEFNGKTYRFKQLSGTSMSSPVVAGICALILQINPYLSPEQVKEIVITTARTDNQTGVIPTNGSTSWGFGKINAMAMVRATLNFVGVEDLEIDTEKWSIYPSPTSSMITLSGITECEVVHLFDVAGKEFKLNEKQTSWDVSGLPSGVYTFRAIANQRVYQRKITIL